MDKAINKRKGVEIHPIAIIIEAGAEICEKNHRKGSYTHREEKLQASTTIHLQGNGTLRGN